MDDIRNNILERGLLSRKNSVFNSFASSTIEKAKETSEEKNKVDKVMGEYKEGNLKSGSKDGKTVTDRKQAIAIAMSEAGLSKAEVDEFPTPDEFFKAYPESGYDYFSEEAIKSYSEDLEKAEDEEDFEKGTKDYSKLSKKLVIDKKGGRKIVYVKEKDKE